jgi:quercetin dioxygenase-like cupin family protein
VHVNRREFVGLAALSPLGVVGGTDSHVNSGKPLILPPDSARVYDIGHGEARILVGTEQSNGVWWLGNFSSDPGRKTSLHVHHSADEQFFVLEGVLSAWLENRWQELPAGGVAIVPRGVPHALGNRSQKPVRFLGAGNPAGFENFFPDIEALSRRLPYASPEFLAELAKVYMKYDSALLGSPPQG